MLKNSEHLVSWVLCLQNLRRDIVDLSLIQIKGGKNIVMLLMVCAQSNVFEGRAPCPLHKV